MAKSRSPKGRPKLSTESPEQRRIRAALILKRLRKDYANPKTELRHENPFQLLIATILSAQCTDERANQVTPGLFAKYPSPVAFAGVGQAEMEKEIRSTGFYRMKSKSIIACSKALVERHGGAVPAEMDALVKLPGVGRKTANVVLGQAFGISSGVVVDTHVHRVSQRLGLTRHDNADRIEEDLMALFPRKDWIELGSILILHGRRVCHARKPDCPRCSVREICPSAEFFLKQMK